MKKIPAGEKVILIKTPKGVYMRTNEGKIYAVRTAGKTGTSAESAATSSAATSGGSISISPAVTSVAKTDSSSSKIDSAGSLVKKMTDAALTKTTLPSGAIVLRMPVPSHGPGVRLHGASLVHSTVGKRTVSVYKISSTTATTLNLANCIKASSKMGAMRPSAIAGVKAVLKKESDEITEELATSGDGEAPSETSDGSDKLAVGKNDMWKNKKMVSIAPVTANRG